MDDRISIDEIGLGNIDRILDDSEYRGAFGHWANTSGLRIYDLARVRQAESIQYVGDEYRHADADEINQNPRPCTDPIFVVDYRYPLKHINYALVSEIWSSRLSHPRLGRMPGSKDRERGLVAKSLSILIAFVDDKATLTKPKEVSAWFENRSGMAAERLGSPWPDVLCRGVSLRSYLSRAKSKRAVARMLDAFSLIHTAQVPMVLGGEKPDGIFEILVECPVIRFDHIVREL